MHATTEAHPETVNFTPPKTPEEALARIKEIYRAKRLESEVIMVAAQTKALETLMACMMPIRSTGDSKLDNFYARERNRQRLAAIQTLLHIRTVQREERMRKAMRAKQKAKAERVAQSVAGGAAKGAMVGAEGAGHADNSSRPGTRMTAPPDSPNHHPSEGASSGPPTHEQHADTSTPDAPNQAATPGAPHRRTGSDRTLPEILTKGY